jgi:predicted HicB family RNase H-like nuclease
MMMKTESFSYKGYTGSSEFSHEDRCLVGQILYIDDLILYEGDSYDDLKKAFQSSVNEYLEFCKKVGKEPQKAYSGSFNVRIGADLHAKAAQKAIQSGVSLNEYVRLAVQEKANAPTAGELTAEIPANAVKWFFPTGPLTYSGTSTATSSGTAAIFSQETLNFSEQNRPMLLTPGQIDSTSLSATTNVVESAKKKPALRRVA